MFKKSVILTGLILITIAAIGPTATAQEKKPIQLALVTPVQIFPEEYHIAGVRFNLIYGRNAYVTGVDFGLVNHTTSGVTKGWQTGLVGIVDADFVGYQSNWVNVVQKNFEGFQYGLVNYAHYCNGFQLGLVNYAGSMKGLQVGLVNIIGQGGQFPVFPIVNWSF